MQCFYLMEEQFGIVCFLSISKNNNNKELIRYNYKNKLLGYVKNICKLSISAQIMIIPIIIYNYHKISLTFLVTSILTSYLIGLIIILGFLLILISFPFFKLAKLFGNIYKLLINLILFITENTAKIPFSKIYLKTPYLFEIIIYYLFIFAVIYLYNKFR